MDRTDPIPPGRPRPDHRRLLFLKDGMPPLPVAPDAVTGTTAKTRLNGELLKAVTMAGAPLDSATDSGECLLAEPLGGRGRGRELRRADPGHGGRFQDAGWKLLKPISRAWALAGAFQASSGMVQ
ncbi:hypothetical protein P3T39_001168 [Kitasatospora sp. GP82]|nr:hypothetical protein [Kitasatospora sp. GP82]